uniref:Gonadoliberin-3 n=1 Tax=Petromyzon marinus TaxID=7757 RepID=GON3_PETMA|nr:RecName: Full=Gonadoliberin-3; AltName: Full=Gonadoliberin III; AltName: Full=Gonadotropin-releasing hormone III; Short=GnRH-III; AltName: Full=Luliberin III [Petromyzon marinus]
QHWSHDWKPG